MKKLIALILIGGLIFFTYLFFKDNSIKEDDVLVKECLNCKYTVNNVKIEIKDGIVHIGNNQYNDIDRIRAKKDIILLTSNKSVVGYKEKELFNYHDDFDSSYSGMNIKTVKILSNKIVIKTTRLIDKNTINVGDGFHICENGNLNYSGMASYKISMTDPVELTYDIKLDGLYEPIVTHKVNLADYYSKIGSC